jgi:hypothetical protein
MPHARKQAGERGCMTITVEESRIRSLFERVEAVE